MADLIFPPSPSTGDEFTGTFGEVYTWDGEKWSLTAGEGGGVGPPVIGDNPPANPGVGQLYWDLPTAKLFLWDGTQWVATINTPAAGPAGPAGPPGSAGPAGPNTLPMGVTDGSDAAAGQIGEFLTFPMNVGSTAPGSIALTTFTLPAGDWLLSGQFNFQPVGGSGATLTTTTVNITNPAFTSIWQGAATPGGNSTNYNYTMAVPPTRVSISVSTLYRVGVTVGTSAGNWALVTLVTGYVSAIYAWRMR